MTNYSKLRVELWSFGVFLSVLWSWPGQSQPPGNQSISIPGYTGTVMVLSQSAGYDLIIILAWPCHYLICPAN